MRWGLVFRRMSFGCFDVAKHLLGRDQKIDVIQVITFGWVHAFSLAHVPATA
jgi:hypothetical protein